MAPRFSLLHVTFVGPEKSAVGVDFGPAVTIIRGPSDTGKSFVVDAIDYMLGASKLRWIPQLAGFSNVLMGVTMPSGHAFTLNRALTGGAFELYEGDLRDIPETEAVATLSAVHSSKSLTNLSNYLLDQLGLSGKKLRKNTSNAKVSLSYRDVAHLSVINETRMQDLTSPGLSGRPAETTKELSALKLFLTGEDDSALVEVPSRTDKRKVEEAQAQVLDRMLDALRPKVDGQPSPDELLMQRNRLGASLADLSRSIQDASHERSLIARRLSSRQNELTSIRGRLKASRSLVARFGLLGAQYASDLERLEMVDEAGSLLGYFAQGACPFCGADQEHQHVEHSEDKNSNGFHKAIASERAKTLGLRADLDETVSDLLIEAETLAQAASDARSSISTLERQLRDAESSLKPSDQTLAGLLKASSQVDDLISLHDRVRELETLQLEIAREAKAEKAIAGEGLTLGAANELSEKLRERLKAWGYPDADHVRYDRGEHDIVDGNQLRSAHGKGVRAILHAAFSVALADLCFERSLPHPGFVVIDSPLVTYRPPKKSEHFESLRDDKLDPSVIGKFYRNLQQDFDGQLIIFENTDPPDALALTTVDVEFTKQLDSGRYGLFEPMAIRDGTLVGSGEDEPQIGG